MLIKLTFFSCSSERTLQNGTFLGGKTKIDKNIDNSKLNYNKYMINLYIIVQKFKNNAIISLKSPNIFPINEILARNETGKHLPMPKTKFQSIKI